MARPKLARNVWVMGWVSFLNDISSEMIYPIVPIFLKNVLGAAPAIIGLIEGIAESTASLLKLVSGWISDRLHKRKAFVGVGYSLSGISKLLLGLSSSWLWVLGARVVDRFGKGARTAARDALILESVAAAERGRAFGLHRMMDTFGAVIGPLVALLMVSWFQNDVRSVFFWAFWPSVVGVLILWLFIKEKKAGSCAVTTAPEAVVKKSFHWRDFDPRFKYFIFVSVVFAIGNSSDAFLILRAQNLGLTLSLTVATYVLYNFVYATLSYPCGVWSDKIGPRRILAASFFLFAAVYGGFGFVQQSWMVWVLFPLYGVYMALSDGVSKAYMATLIPVENAGTAFGAYQMAIGLCVLLASIVAGLWWNFVHPAAVFWWGGGLALVAGLLFICRR